MGSVVTLEGDLGSGKTTFAQGFAKGLGIERVVKSPTYTIVREYPINDDEEFIHIDAYRLEEGGAETVDFDYLMHDKTIVLIEWAIFMQDFLPKNYINISFKPLEDNESRLIEVEVIGSNKNPYHDIVQRWLNE